MTGKRRGGLGRGLGALIPSGPAPDSGDSTDSTDRLGSAASVNGNDALVTSALPPSVGSLGNGANPDPTVSDRTGSGPTGSDPTASERIGADLIDGPGPVPGARFAEIDIDRITANAKQPRQVFDQDALAELTHSIREFGVLQPVVVRASGDGFELIMGERRLRAAQAAGLTAIPAIIRDTADDAMLRDALLENIHRAALNPLEEAAAYQQLLEEFGTTHEELATRIGRSRSQVSNTIRLLNLPVAVQRRVAAGVLSAGHARALLGLDDRDRQDELATRIVAEGLSVRATEELVSLAAKEQTGGRAARARSTPRITAPGVTDLADKLSDTFDTRVKVELGRRRGKITVEFASVDDLERIVALMAPQLVARRSD
jgi:ParB family chromosome partitioning protein